MSQQEIFHRVQAVTSELLKVPTERVTAGARLVEDLSVDSLYLTELAMALEEAFDISVPDEDIPGLTTVGAMAEYVAQRMTERVNA